ncbi:MAG: hypothetical protein ACKO96_30710, partial [Flammeovirgaceae bacterium]
VLIEIQYKQFDDCTLLSSLVFKHNCINHCGCKLKTVNNEIVKVDYLSPVPKSLIGNPDSEYT